MADRDFTPLAGVEPSPELLAKIHQYYLDRQPREAYVFVCADCGNRRRDASILDPGTLYQHRTCAMAQRSCMEPSDPEPVTPPHFLPGSIVTIYYKNEEWPAIVDFSLRGDCAYKRGEGANALYYVTIVKENMNEMLGAWLHQSRLDPTFSQRCPIDLSPHNKALRYASQFLGISLADRHYALSYGVWALEHGGFTFSGAGQIRAREELANRRPEEESSYSDNVEVD